MHSFIRSALAILVMTASTFAWSQDPAKAASAKPVYAVLSLIGDRLDIVVREIQIGTRVNANRRDPLAMPDPVFDTVAVSASAKGVRAANANAEISHLNTRSPVLFEKHRDLFSVSQSVMSMPEPIRDALKGQGATHLVLITKHREEALFRFADKTNEGAGSLEGLGFYLDTTIETFNYNTKTGDRSKTGVGFIAPYAFITVQLVEFPSGRVLGKKSVADYHIVGSGNSETDISQPWQAMTSAQKVQAVAQLVDRTVAKSVQELVGSAR